MIAKDLEKFFPVIFDREKNSRSAVLLCKSTVLIYGSSQAVSVYCPQMSCLR